MKPSVPSIQSHLYTTDVTELPLFSGPSRLLFPEASILTPGVGSNFTPYVTRLLERLYRNWYVPKEGRAKTRERDSLSVIFKIRRNGRLARKPTLEVSSGKKPVDDAAIDAIRFSAPFEHLPKSFKDPYIELRLTFFY